MIKSLPFTLPRASCPRWVINWKHLKRLKLRCPERRGIEAWFIFLLPSVHSIPSVSIRFLWLWQNTRENKLKGGKIYFSEWFQGFLSTLASGISGPVGSSWSWSWVCGRAKLLTSWWLGSKESKRWRSWRQSVSFKGTSLITYFLQWGPAS
jgi:hypothetical protein